MISEWKDVQAFYFDGRKWGKLDVLEVLEGEGGTSLYTPFDVYVNVLTFKFLSLSDS